MINIRPATETDIKHIVEFNMAMALETENKHLPYDILHSGVKRVFVQKQLGFYLLAEINHQIAGCLMITTEWSDWRNGLFWWFQSVYVKPDYRLKGVFKTLYRQVETMAHKDTDVIGLRLYVEENNKIAQQTYLSLGMKKTQYYLFEDMFSND